MAAESETRESDGTAGASPEPDEAQHDDGENAPAGPQPADASGDDASSDGEAAGDAASEDAAPDDLTPDSEAPGSEGLPGAAERAEFHADSLRDEADREDNAGDPGAGPGGAEDAPGPRGANTDAPPAHEAAAPDHVIREPDDVEPDTTDGEVGEAVQVTADGERTTMDAPPTDRKRAALVYNPTKVDPDQLRTLVSRLAEEAEWAEPLFFETTVDDLGDDAARAALEEGADAILVAGGDGTVRAVSEALTDTGVPLTIVPSGTGNLLARNLNLPLTDPDAMVRATFEGDVIAIDAGVARLRREDGSTEEHGFVVMAGMGLDAAMIANTNPQLKKTVGWVAYVDGAARSLVTAKPFRIVYQLDDQRLHSARVQSILFANCGSLPAGIALIPEASIADGLLDVAVIQPAGAFGWLGVWRKIWWDNSFLRRFRAGRRVLERRGRGTSVHFRRGHGIETATSPAQPVELDGDEFGEATRIFCRIVPGGLQIAVPRGHDTSSL